jgi:AcrR family transcriptional regulator
MVRLRGVSEARAVPSRRDQHAEETRNALLDSAEHCFAIDGFAATTLDKVAADARVTKGAVYHHFANKRAVFEAVLDRMEEVTVEATIAAAATHDDAWEGGLAALAVALDRFLDPAYQRICFVEGPHALGFDRWWACGERHQIGVIRTLLTALADQDVIDVPPEQHEPLSNLLFGLMTAAAISLARSKRPKPLREQLYSVIVRILEGLRRR